MFPVTLKPTPPTVFNLQASDWVHCEEETGAYYQLFRHIYKLIKKKIHKFLKLFILPKKVLIKKKSVKFIIHFLFKKR